MTNQDLQRLLSGINSCGNLKGVKFSYALSKNRKMIMAELETLQEAIKPSEAFAEYDKKRIELCEKFADQENGKAKLVNNNYVFSDENKAKFEKAMEEIKDEEIIKEREAQFKEFNELLKKESDFKPFMIAYEDVPSEITASAMDAIIDLISEPK